MKRDIPHLILTSIAPPNPVMRALAQGASATGWSMIVVGDVSSPSDFSLDGVNFIGISDQNQLDLSFPGLCPRRHYARKNIGYLLAIRQGAPFIVETDDDNIPLPSFFHPRQQHHTARSAQDGGWINVYRYFSDAPVWPRGLPLNAVQTAPPSFDGLESASRDCPIQQGLADDNPDVDAIYRLIMPLPLRFRPGRMVALGNGSWCPFNSQNTTWWPSAYPLLYLPAYCSFRMTDIWRSFVAQRIAWVNDWHVLFHEATVRQERNEHDLMKDFVDEIPGYANNWRIAESLMKLNLKPGRAEIGDNMRLCYDALIGMGLVARDEEKTLEAWLSDISNINCP